MFITSPPKEMKMATKKSKKSTAKKSLNTKQEQFCREYIVDLDAKRAYEAAGYKATGMSAYVNANRLLKNAKISARISELKEKSIKRLKNEEELDISADAVLREMGRVAMFRPEDFASVDESTGKVRYLITPDNLHKLAGITGLKIKECPPIKVVEAGVEIEREVLEVDFKSDKTRALEALMKHHGILQEKVEVAGMNELISALHKGRERVAKLREEREKAKGDKNA